MQYSNGCGTVSLNVVGGNGSGTFLHCTVAGFITKETSAEFLVEEMRDDSVERARRRQSRSRARLMRRVYVSPSSYRVRVPPLLLPLPPPFGTNQMYK